MRIDLSPGGAVVVRSGGSRLGRESSGFEPYPEHRLFLGGGKAGPEVTGWYNLVK
jgi:hypothetical protein